MESWIQKFKQQVPMPETCPFCGRRLTPENARVDHIIPAKLGGKNEINNLRYLCNRCNILKADRFDRVLEYFIRYMNQIGQSDDDTKMKMEYLLRNASDKDLRVLDNRVRELVGSYRRLTAYHNEISKIWQNNQIPDEPKSNEVIESMEALLKGYEHYDYKRELRREINGNIFNYDKSFPIEKYTTILSSYGEEKKGEVYAVYLDESGELVVY